VRDYRTIIRLACLVEAGRYPSFAATPELVVKAASTFEDYVTDDTRKDGNVAADAGENTTFHTVSEEAQSFADTCAYVTRMTVELRSLLSVWRRSTRSVALSASTG
jgi:hypothetical protein